MRDSTPSTIDANSSGSGQLYICTWLFAESDEEASTYPQVPGRSTSAGFQSTYWRCVAAFFATSYRHQPDAKHLLFTNLDTLPEISGVRLSALLGQLGVEVIQLPMTHTTPPGHFPAWRNQFYVFDIASYLGDRVQDEDTVLVLDSDCVWVSGAGAVQDAVRRDGVLTYVENFPLDWPENGLTRSDMQALSTALLGYEVPHPLIYCGGELVAATGSELRRLNVEIAKAWDALLERAQAGLFTFNEEAQLLSHVYYVLGCPVGNGNPYVRRIWTGSFGAYRTATPQDLGLVVWHLPLEKRLGIRRLYDALLDPTSRFWRLDPHTEMAPYLGAMLGVPRNSLAKKMRDLTRRVLDKLRRD